MTDPETRPPTCPPPGAPAPSGPADSESRSAPALASDDSVTRTEVRAATIVLDFEHAATLADALTRTEEKHHEQLRAAIHHAARLHRHALADPAAFEIAVGARAQALTAADGNFRVPPGIRTNTAALIIYLLFPRHTGERRSTYAAALRRLAELASSDEEVERHLDIDGVEGLARQTREPKAATSLEALRRDVAALGAARANVALKLPPGLVPGCDTEAVLLVQRLADGSFSVCGATGEVALLRATVKALTKPRADKAGGVATTGDGTRPKEPVGAWIQERMAALGLSFTELAARAHLNWQSVQRFARGSKVPGRDSYAKLVAVLGDGRGPCA